MGLGPTLQIFWINLAFPHVFHDIAQHTSILEMSKMLFLMSVKYHLLISYSRKVITASKRDKNGRGHKVGQVKIAPMGPPWLLLYVVRVAACPRTRYLLARQWL